MTPLKYKRTKEKFGPLSTFVVCPKHDTPVDALLVLMHGFGAPRDNLVDMAQPIVQAAYKHDVTLAIAFPGGPMLLEDYGGGAAAWWEINMARLMEATMKGSFEEMRNEVPPGILEARAAVVECIAALQARFNIEHDRLTVGGFSQGAMLAVDVSICGLPKPPANIVALSGALICQDLWQTAAGERMKRTKVFQSHGTNDPVLPLVTGKMLHELLQELCEQAELLVFDGYHQVPPECYEKIAGLIAA